MPPKRPANSSSASRAKRVKTPARAVRGVRTNSAKRLQDVKIVKLPNPRVRGAFTIVATRSAKIGDSGVIDGVRYVVRDERGLGRLIMQNKWRDVERTCTSRITNMKEMFRWSSLFGNEIQHWDTSSVTTMERMFVDLHWFNGPIGAWDTSKVTNMGGMFDGAERFNQSIGAWDTGKVTNMERMFDRAEAFNQSIGAWNTRRVTNMKQMFNGAAKFNRPIGGWDTRRVTNMEGMFSGAAAFNQSIGAWNTSSLKEMWGMFRGAAAFNRDISHWVGRLPENVDRDFASEMISSDVRNTVRRLSLNRIFPSRRPSHIRIHSVQMLKIFRETYPDYRPSQNEYEGLHEMLGHIPLGYRLSVNRLEKERVIMLIDFLNREDERLAPGMRYNKTRSRAIIRSINGRTNRKRAAAIDSINQAAANKKLHLPRELVAKILTAASIKTLPYTHYIQR